MAKQEWQLLTPADLRRVAETLGHTDSVAAEFFGVTEGTYTRWLRGGRPPSALVQLSLVETIKLKVPDLVPASPQAEAVDVPPAPGIVEILTKHLSCDGARCWSVEDLEATTRLPTEQIDRALRQLQHAGRVIRSGFSYMWVESGSPQDDQPAEAAVEQEGQEGQTAEEPVTFTAAFMESLQQVPPEDDTSEIDPTATTEAVASPTLLRPLPLTDDRAEAIGRIVTSYLKDNNVPLDKVGGLVAEVRRALS